MKKTSYRCLYLCQESDQFFLDIFHEINQMKRFFTTAFFLLTAASLLTSWGRPGHQIIAGIAAAHLTPKTKAAVAGLLGAETMVSVSSYADEIRPDSFFLFTGVWHYMDFPPEENYPTFIRSVNNMGDSNIYHVLLHWERVLRDTTINRSIRNFGLKMVIHLVGDAHQPMHVARSNDQGGNLIPLLFMGDSTNLHGLWDSRLIAHTRLSVDSLTKQWDTAGAATIRQWQSDSLVNWLYESNQISNVLYGEVTKNESLGEPYYRSHIGTVQNRIDRAGIRLAAVLNTIFDPGTQTKP